MDRKFLVILFGAATLAMPALAQQGANFNGTWTLDKAKSSFGQFPPPQSETDTIQINGSDFQQHVSSVSARGTQTFTRACALDGKEVTFAPDDPKAQLMPGLKLSKLQCGWDGNSVFVLETVPFQGAVLTDKMTFSVDGSTLTMTGHIASSAMNGDRTYVYEKGGSASADAAPANGGMAATPGAAAMIHTGAEPNLSGTWKLDPAQSKFGQIPPPASQVDTIQQDGSSVKIAVDQKGGVMGDTAYTESLTTDGASATWPGVGGTQVTGTAQWTGGSLVVDSKTSFQGSDVKIKDTLTLTDPNTLTEVTHIESGMGNFDTTSVFTKQ
ncbi:MAG TPA: hypothetical protein VHX36_08410 [Candidatus Acidoferrales bacterium]|jgi:hypothetical protein|nr:hypothetical protein [Candidatus Acidoferrales bacterium]